MNSRNIKQAASAKLIGKRLAVTVSSVAMVGSAAPIRPLLVTPAFAEQDDGVDVENAQATGSTGSTENEDAGSSSTAADSEGSDNDAAEFDDGESDTQEAEGAEEGENELVDSTQSAGSANEELVTESQFANSAVGTGATDDTTSIQTTQITINEKKVDVEGNGTEDAPYLVKQCSYENGESTAAVTGGEVLAALLSQDGVAYLKLAEDVTFTTRIESKGTKYLDITEYNLINETPYSGIVVSGALSVTGDSTNNASYRITKKSSINVGAFLFYVSNNATLNINGGDYQGDKEITYNWDGSGYYNGGLIIVQKNANETKATGSTIKIDGAKFTAYNAVINTVTYGTRYYQYADITVKNTEVEYESDSPTNAWFAAFVLSACNATFENVTVNSKKGMCAEISSSSPKVTVGTQTFEETTTTLKDCIFKNTDANSANYSAASYRQAALALDFGSKVTVEGGEYFSNAYGIYIFSSGGHLTIKDGAKVSGTTASVRSDFNLGTYGPNSSQKDWQYAAEVTVEDGVFSGPVKKGNDAKVGEADYNKIVLKGGEYSVQPDNGLVVSGKSAKQSGGKWYIVSDSDVDLASLQNLTMDGTYDGSDLTPSFTYSESKSLTTSDFDYTITSYTAPGNNAASTETPTSINAAGTYSLALTGKNNAFGTTTATVTVEPLEASLTWSGDSFTYDGQSHVPTATVSNLVGDECTVTVGGEQTNAGTSYTATAESLSNSNYKLPSEKTHSFAITPATMEVTAEGWSGTYDGSAHGITVTAPEGATVTYSADNDTFGADNPTYSAVGSYTVYYKVTKANYSDVTGSAVVSISNRPSTQPSGPSAPSAPSSTTETDATNNGDGTTTETTTTTTTTGNTTTTTEVATTTDADGNAVGSTETTTVETATDGTTTTTETVTERDADGNVTSTTRTEASESVADDGAVTSKESVTSTAADGSSETSESETVTDADGNLASERRSSSVTDADGNVTSRSEESTSVERAEDGTVTTTEKASAQAADGSSSESETVTEARPDGSSTTESSSTQTDADGTVTETSAVTEAAADGSSTTESRTTVTGPDGEVASTTVATSTTAPTDDGGLVTEEKAVTETTDPETGKDLTVTEERTVTTDADGNETETSTLTEELGDMTEEGDKVTVTETDEDGAVTVTEDTVTAVDERGGSGAPSARTVSVARTVTLPDGTTETSASSATSVTRPDGSPGEGWEFVDGDWYYVDGGVAETGQADIGRHTYVFGGDGAMKVGWDQDADGNWRFLCDDHGGAFGAMFKDSWLSDGRGWYMVDRDGSMLTGWQWQGGEWYYLNPRSDGHKGEMRTGWTFDGHAWYALDPSDGRMMRDTVLDGWRVGPDGRWMA